MAEQATPKPNGPDIDKAWEYHKEADALLHSRVESFFVAQAFLIAAFVYLLVEDEQRRFIAIGWAVMTLGLVITIAILNLNRRLIRRITALKHNYLRHDPVYPKYMLSLPSDAKIGDKDDITEGWARMILPVWIPRLFFTFWLFSAVWSIAQWSAIAELCVDGGNYVCAGLERLRAAAD